MSDVAIASIVNDGVLVDGAELGEAAAPRARALASARRRALRRRTSRTEHRPDLPLDAALLRAVLQIELGVAATVALVLSTIVDYKRWLHTTDPATGWARAQTSTIAKQLSALRGFARWLALDGHLAIWAQTRSPAPDPPDGRASGKTSQAMLVGYVTAQVSLAVIGVPAAVVVS